MLNQRLQQGLFHKFSPQQIQLMKMLELHTTQLEIRIREELETNPALEEVEIVDSEIPETSDDSNSLEDETINEAEEQEEDDNIADEIDIADYYDQDNDEVPSYKTNDPSEWYNSENEVKSVPVSAAPNFREYLSSQISVLNLNEDQVQIALHILGNLDDDGYLRRDLDAMVDDLAFRHGLHTDIKELQLILEQIQKLDPPGVGARTLQECLFIQLKRKENPDITNEIAIRIIECYFDLFAKKHYDKLETIFNINSDKLKKAIEVITGLNPKPGGGYFDGSPNARITVIPDFILSNDNGELVLSLNSRNAPQLRISDHFKEMVAHYKKAKVTRSQKEAILFMKQKMDSAKWFIDAIQSRYTTMLLTMNAIIEYQREYLLTGDESRLRPMILKTIAEKTGLDISTISRVANSKYVQTEFGNIPLKYFFSVGLATDGGEEVSTREVKKILSDLIEKECKKRPVSDQKLTSILKERSYNIARRTVAKYREQLNLPIARLRREL